MFIIYQAVIYMMVQFIEKLIINHFYFQNILNFGDGLHGKISGISFMKLRLLIGEKIKKNF